MTDPRTDPICLLTDLLDRAVPPARATPAQVRAWANQHARIIAAQVEPLIASRLRLAVAGDGAAQAAARASLERLRVHGILSMRRAKTNVRDFPQ